MKVAKQLLSDFAIHGTALCVTCSGGAIFNRRSLRSSQQSRPYRETLFFFYQGYILYSGKVVEKNTLTHVQQLIKMERDKKVLKKDIFKHRYLLYEAKDDPLGGG